MGEAQVVMDSQPIIRVSGLRKDYKKRTVLRGIDLWIERGEIYGLIGPDGAGKSSLMKAIAGVLSFEEGEVEVFGTAIDSERAAEAVKGKIGFMPQGLGLNLYPELSIEENIDFFARLRLVPESELKERKSRLLSMTRLDRFRDRPMKHLSGGMKQKLGLVCTLIHEPELIILDEPTTGVDPVSRRDFWYILSELIHERGITALVSTAYMDEAVRFHRISLMYDGRVLAEGAPEKLETMIRGTVVAFRTDAQVEALFRLKSAFPQVEATGPWIRVFVDRAGPEEASNMVERALAGIRAEGLEARGAELEDFFIALLRRQKLAEEAYSVPQTAPVHPVSKKGETAIEAVGLVRNFDSFRAVDRVSFSVKQGEIFGLLGANGAGKTTVIKMLTGIIAPSAGEGRVAGADVRRAGHSVKERIGYMSQAFSLYHDLTVVENIKLYAGIYGLTMMEARKRLEWVIEMAGLSGRKSDLAGSLPMGLRQRLALGCALVHRPQILFLDEPTSGVDPIGRRRFWEILFRLSREEGVSLLVTTHYMSEAEHCDHLALMFAGRIVADDSPENIKRQVEEEAGSLLEISVEDPTAALKHLLKKGFPDAALFGRHIHVLSKKPDEESGRISRILSEEGMKVAGVFTSRLTMEDVFVHRVTELEKRNDASVRGGGA